MSEEETTILAKLDTLKEIRNRTILLEKVRANLKQELDAADKKEKDLVELRKEMELLLQEKMAHVEELRLIHSDINMMESIIKQSDDGYKQSLEKTKRLLSAYQPLKKQVDDLRLSIGLGKLADSDVDAASSYLETGSTDLKRKSEEQPKDDHAAAAALGAGACRSQSVTLPAAAADSQDSPRSKMQRPAGVRQQLPPMKCCSSCHQQIHRNAPICPLCKAKSRSRNPKKSKRRE